jgi:hypothetical protein
MPAYSGYRLTFTNGTTARINVASVEFSDLGVKVGEAVPELSISGAGRVDVRTNNLVDTPEIGAVAALNSVSGSWSLGKCNNGFGNGDQAAPGGSQTKNGAENNTSGNAK